MFERLIITEPKTSQNRDRKGYFLITFIFMSTTLVAGVVGSIFSADFALGTDNFELVRLIAPVEQPSTAPEPPAPEKPLPSRINNTPAEVKLPTRQVNMARVDESPREVPKNVSTTQNTQKERPKSGYFEVGKFDTDPVGGVAGRETRGTSEGGGSGLAVTAGPVAKVVQETTPPPPPPVKKDPPVEKKPPIQSLGVVNGKATSLPVPVYSAAAKAVNAQGRVSVQVLISENGQVVSASAVSGHPLLRAASEAAARQARFTPTLLSGVPVKISGVIVYNFSG
jgi:TonB family protein